MASRHAARGQSFELALEAQHRVYAAQGLAWVRRVSTPVKVMGHVGRDARGRSRFSAAFDGPQGVDFVGLLTGGRHVAIEAKSHADRGAWSSGVKADGALGSGSLGAAQWSELRCVEAAGGVAVIALQAWGGVWAFRPVDLVRHAEMAGRSTVRREEVEAVGVALRGLDWLREAT